MGILVGLTGIGGGSLMTPLLLLAVGMPPIVAIGTDLALWRDHQRVAARSASVRITTPLASQDTISASPGWVIVL